MLPPLVVVPLVLGLMGCSSGAREVQPPSPTAPPPLDTPQTGLPQQTGHLLVQALSARCGIITVTGTHAEFTPEHPLCKVRVRVTSNDSSFHTFDIAEQRLVLADGTLVATHPDAMNIKRQPRSVELGARNAHELDLWFSPQSASPASGLRLVGDHDTNPLATAGQTDAVVLPLELPGATTGAQESTPR
ncbi:MAG: hypothetical protein ABIM89_13100 [Mycobacteriales bacterium]